MTALEPRTGASPITAAGSPTPRRHVAVALRRAVWLNAGGCVVRGLPCRSQPRPQPRSYGGPALPAVRLGRYLLIPQPARLGAHLAAGGHPRCGSTCRAPATARGPADPGRVAGWVAGRSCRPASGCATSGRPVVLLGGDRHERPGARAALDGGAPSTISSCGRRRRAGGRLLRELNAFAAGGRRRARRPGGSRSRR